MKRFIFQQKTKAVTRGVLKTKRVLKNNCHESHQVTFAAKTLEKYLWRGLFILSFRLNTWKFTKNDFHHRYLSWILTAYFRAPIFQSTSFRLLLRRYATVLKMNSFASSFSSILLNFPVIFFLNFEKVGKFF